MNKNFYNRGLSVVELIMVVAVVAILVAIVVPSFVSLRKNQALQNSTNSVVSLLQEARTKTLASYNNTFYSVYLGTNEITMFTGGTYSSSDSTNKVVSYESPVTLQSNSLNGGGSQISFDRLKGTTSQYGTIVVGISGGSSKTITVSDSGIVSRN
jgi:type IV fimbrial biogenesis protein FimT